VLNCSSTHNTEPTSAGVTNSAKKNRFVLLGFIDDVCYLANQEHLFRGHDGLSKILNKMEFVGFLNFLKNHDPIHQTIMSNQLLLLNVQYKFVSNFK
jgi:hypothetical protein